MESTFKSIRINMSRAATAALCAVMLTAPAGTLRAQSGSMCLPPDDAAELILAGFASTVASSDSGVKSDLTGLGFLPTDSASVQFVTDSTTCARAAVALSHHTPSDSTVYPTHVIAVGPRRFIVFNYRQKFAGSVWINVFDEEWRRLGIFRL